MLRLDPRPRRSGSGGSLIHLNRQTAETGEPCETIAHLRFLRVHSLSQQDFSPQFTGVTDKFSTYSMATDGSDKLNALKHIRNNSAVLFAGVFLSTRSL